MRMAFPRHRVCPRCGNVLAVEMLQPCDGHLHPRLVCLCGFDATIHNVMFPEE